MPDHQVAVVGGGLAGLNAARLLAAANIDVTLFEAAESVGGRVRTDSSDGFTLDRGFQVLFTAYPEAQRALDFDDLDLRTFPPGALICRPNHRSILTDPFRDPRRAIEAAFSRDITIGDKWRTLRLRRRLQQRSRAEIFDSPDQRIDEYLRENGFSQRFLENFAAPLYGGITLDRSLSTSSRVFKYSFKMLSSGDTAIPAEGMGAITRQLAEKARKAGASIETGERINHIEGTGPVELSGSSGSWTAESVVVATDPQASRNLTGIDSIPTEGRSSVTQYFSLPTANPLNGQSRLLLNAAGSVPTTVANLSAVEPSYSPDDRLLLSASTPGAQNVSSDELAETTKQALASWYPEGSFEDLSVLRTVRIPFAQFDQPPGIHEGLPEVSDPPGSVYLAGEYTEDSSINGALSSGRQAASAVRDGL